MYDWAYVPYPGGAEGFQCALLVRRAIGKPHEITFYLTHAPEGTGLAASQDAIYLPPKYGSMVLLVASARVGSTPTPFAPSGGCSVLFHSIQCFDSTRYPRGGNTTS